VGTHPLVVFEDADAMSGCSGRREVRIGYGLGDTTMV
jgi:hypothetical protein